MRIISGLIWAEPCPRPASIPKSRPRGKKAAGLRYERVLAAALPEAKHGQWFRFEDRRGAGCCQTDLILSVAGATVVLEAKYTWTAEGHAQLDRLYLPVLKQALGRSAYGMVVCKVLTPGTPRDWVCGNLADAIYRAGTGLPTVLHWIGASPGPLELRPKGSHLASQEAHL